MTLSKSNFNFSFPIFDQQWVNGELQENSVLIPSTNVVSSNLKRLIIDNQYNIFHPYEITENITLDKETIDTKDYYINPDSVFFTNKYNDSNNVSLYILCSTNGDFISNNNNVANSIFLEYDIKIIISNDASNEDNGEIKNSILAMALQAFIYKFPPEEILLNWPSNIETLEKQKLFWPTISLTSTVKNKPSLAQFFTGTNKCIREITFSYLMGFSPKSNKIF